MSKYDDRRVAFRKTFLLPTKSRCHSLLRSRTWMKRRYPFSGAHQFRNRVSPGGVVNNCFGLRWWRDSAVQSVHLLINDLRQYSDFAMSCDAEVPFQTWNTPSIDPFPPWLPASSVEPLSATLESYVSSLESEPRMMTECHILAAHPFPTSFIFFLYLSLKTSKLDLSHEMRNHG